LLLSGGKCDLFLLKTQPGYITGTMGFSTHAAMAMRTPLTGQARNKYNGTTQTTSRSLFVRVH
jgi:hypothetical protein